LSTPVLKSTNLILKSILLSHCFLRSDCSKAALLGQDLFALSPCHLHRSAGLILSLLKCSVGLISDRGCVGIGLAQDLFGGLLRLRDDLLNLSKKLASLMLTMLTYALCLNCGFGNEPIGLVLCIAELKVDADSGLLCLFLNSGHDALDVYSQHLCRP
jgi:hypothetical protein